MLKNWKKSWLCMVKYALLMVEMLEVIEVDRDDAVYELQRSNETIQSHWGISDGILMTASLGPGCIARVHFVAGVASGFLCDN